MAKTPQGGSPAAQTLAPPTFRPIDAIMILLALVSVTLVFLDIFARQRLYDWHLFRAIIITDAIITGIFLVDFIVENRGKSPGRIVRDSWFDIVGLVPMIAFVYLEARISGHPFGAVFNEEIRLASGAAAGGSLLRLFRFVRIVRIVQAFSRFLRATNMTFGETVTKGFFDKYRRIIVAELTTPIMVAGITLTQELVIRMKFLESVGKAIDEQRPQIHQAVVEAMRQNRVPDQIIAQPVVDKITLQVEKAVVDNIVATLTGPELNALTQKMIVDVMENFKQQLQSPEGRALLKQMGDAPPGQKDLPKPKLATEAPGDRRFDGPSGF
ncbi:MAG TPA: ion transporter [Candidatus Thermoplasmatota archaeon]|nr:ion transporter [Candidatus Thermoplasmatota archaeon]